MAHKLALAGGGREPPDFEDPPPFEKFVIRLPEGLRDRIRKQSERNHRSMNAEILLMLEQSLEREGENIP